EPEPPLVVSVGDGEPQGSVPFTSTEPAASQAEDAPGGAPEPPLPPTEDTLGDSDQPTQENG
ncbi:MAG: hypothetical protein AB1551_00150, partial [Actinomycetota bacterium]